MAAEVAETFNMTARFMEALEEMLGTMSTSFPSCRRTQRFVEGFRANRNAPRVGETSVSRWHQEMRDYYVDIAQRKDEVRLDRAMRAAAKKSWFLRAMDIATKWPDASTFDSHRPHFVHAVRTLNAYAYLQNSFLGRMQRALEEVTSRYSLDTDGMSPDVLTDIASKMMNTLSAKELREVNKILPHIVHIIGGVEEFDRLMDQVLSHESGLRPVLGEFAKMFRGSSDEGDAGAEGEDELLDRGKAHFRAALRTLADPDNDRSMVDILKGMGVEGMEERKEEDDARLDEAFETMRETFKDPEMIGSVMQMAMQVAQQHPDATTDQIATFAQEMLSSRGMDVDMSGVRAAASAAFQSLHES